MANKFFNQPDEIGLQQVEDGQYFALGTDLYVRVASVMRNQPVSADPEVESEAIEQVVTMKLTREGGELVDLDPETTVLEVKQVRQFSIAY